MTENFKETVDLKERMNNLNKAKQQQKIIQQSKIAKSRDMDRLFDDGSSRQSQQEKIQKIERPERGGSDGSFGKQLVFVLVGLIIIGVFYFAFFHKSNNKVVKNTDSNWYAVKLINNEVYYGQITDIGSDPVVITNVYYNYDQLKQDGNAKAADDKSNSLRLVKRGKETYGPSGSMNMVRSQVVYMEPLKPDSKVLQAILDYEK